MQDTHKTKEPKYKKGAKVWWARGYPFDIEEVKIVDCDYYWKRRPISPWPDEMVYIVKNEYGNKIQTYESLIYESEVEAALAQVEIIEKYIEENKQRNKDYSKYIKKVKSKYLKARP